MSTFLFFYFLSLFRSRVIQRLRVLFFLFFLRWRRPWLAAEAAVGSQSETAKRKRARAPIESDFFFLPPHPQRGGFPNSLPTKKMLFLCFFFILRTSHFGVLGLLVFFFYCGDGASVGGKSLLVFFFCQRRRRGRKKRNEKQKTTATKEEDGHHQQSEFFLVFFFFWVCERAEIAIRHVLPSMRGVIDRSDSANSPFIVHHNVGFKKKSFHLSVVLKPY